MLLVLFVGTCVGEAGSFNNGVARCAVGAYCNFYCGVVFVILLRVSGRVYKSVVGSLYPRKIMLFLYTNSHFSSMKVTLHPALHRILMPIRDAVVIPGTIWPANIVGRPGMVMSQMWVETTLLPLGKVMVIGWSARHKFLMGVPFIMKIEVAHVSAMAAVV